MGLGGLMANYRIPGCARTGKLRAGHSHGQPAADAAPQCCCSRFCGAAHDWANVAGCCILAQHAQHSMHSTHQQGLRQGVGALLAH